MTRFRPAQWGAAAAAAALTAAVLTVAPIVRANVAPGTPPPAPATFVPITPCRLADTRPAPSTVGTRATPIGENETVAFTVRGQNGQCNIPASATGIAANVTAVNPTAAGFVTLFPADAPTRPLASNLNLLPGGAPTPNQVTVKLSATGVVNAFNRFGSVDLIVDIVGYYTPAAGYPGATIPPGVTVTGIEHLDSVTTGFSGTDGFSVDLPGAAPAAFDVSFTPGTGNDTDPDCNGTLQAPTAPPGMVCIYPALSGGIVPAGWSAGPTSDMPLRAFRVLYDPVDTAGLDLVAHFTWAYTAPLSAPAPDPDDQQG